MQSERHGRLFAELARLGWSVRLEPDGSPALVGGKAKVPAWLLDQLKANRESIVEELRRQLKPAPTRRVVLLDAAGGVARVLWEGFPEKPAGRIPIPANAETEKARQLAAELQSPVAAEWLDGRGKWVRYLTIGGDSC